MKLEFGIKPLTVKIKKGTAHIMKRTGDYIEIQINDIAEINKLKTLGFKEVN